MIQVYLIDCKASEGTLLDCARAINFPMTRLEVEGFFAQLFGEISMQVVEKLVKFRV